MSGLLGAVLAAQRQPFLLDGKPHAPHIISDLNVLWNISGEPSFVGKLGAHGEVLAHSAALET